MAPTLLFAPAGYNLAETTRTLEIAKACREHFDIIFASYGGEFEHLIAEAGYLVRSLEPHLTQEKIDHLYKVDQGQAFGYFFSREEVEEQVKNEIALLEEIKPAAVITGFVFSNNISCRVSGVPLVWLTHSTWNFTTLREKGMCTYPDMIDVPPLRWLPEMVLTRISIVLMGAFVWTFKPFNQVAERYGLPTTKSLEKWWEGDYNLLAEPKGFCPIDLPPTYHFIGPLLGRLDSPIPDEVISMPRDKPIVYFAMGSSGQPDVVAQIVEGFSGKPYRVIAPVKSLLAKARKQPVEVPDNVAVTDWLPAHKVNKMADLSVIHGGIGTTFTACLAGKPVVGVSMQPEQEINIDCLVRLGFARRIRKTRLTPTLLCDAIDQLLADDHAKRKALEFQKVVEKWDDPSLITKFFVEAFLDQVTEG